MSPSLLSFITPMRDWAIEAPLIHTAAVPLKDHQLRLALLGPEYTF
ncbi:MAG: hypothetical protein Q4G50_04015 [Corynebacterium sp.]|nr:hypothetical protein [Corynebacterium sp.]MDO5669148.1 hypothetical protein [Corynebacterium sp.]